MLRGGGGTGIHLALPRLRYRDLVDRFMQADHRGVRQIVCRLIQAVIYRSTRCHLNWQ